MLKADGWYVVAIHLEGMAEDGDPIPHPSGPGVYVERKAIAAA
jgi:hypothetical protein